MRHDERPIHETESGWSRRGRGQGNGDRVEFFAGLKVLEIGCSDGNPLTRLNCVHSEMLKMANFMFVYFIAI